MARLLVPRVFAALVLVLVACGGSSLVTDHPDAGDDVDLGGASRSDFEGGGYDPGGGAGSFTAAQVQAALAQCSLPHGAPVSITDAAEVSALMVGAWVLCPGAPSDPAVFAPAILFDADGTWTRLTPGGAGGGFPSVLEADGGETLDEDAGLAATPGLADQGTWLTGCEASSSITANQQCVFSGQEDVLVGIDSDGHGPGDCYGGSITFESSPRRMYVVGGPYYDDCAPEDAGFFTLWLVPL